MSKGQDLLFKENLRSFCWVTSFNKTKGFVRDVWFVSDLSVNKKTYFLSSQMYQMLEGILNLNLCEIFF